MRAAARPSVAELVPLTEQAVRWLRAADGSG